MKSRTTVASLLIIGCSPVALASHMASSSVNTSIGGSIDTESAIPLPAGAWSFAVRYEEQRFDRLSESELLSLAEADAEADLHSIEAVKTSLFNVSYGVNENLSLGMSIPLVERTDIRAPHFHAADNEFEIEHEGASKGVGDIKLYGLWRFSRSDDHSTSLIFGLSTPTGKDDDTSPDGELYEPEFQPGSGSWDPLIGIAFSRSFAGFSLDASTTYSFVNEGAQQTNLGDWLTYNVGVGRLLHIDSSLDWRVVLEANGLWRDRLSEAGEEKRNSGGHWLNIAPGIIASSERWSVFANVAFPVINDPNGDQDEQDYRFQVGFQFML